MAGGVDAYAVDVLYWADAEYVFKSSLKLTGRYVFQFGECCHGNRFSVVCAYIVDNLRHLFVGVERTVCFVDILGGACNTNDVAFFAEKGDFVGCKPSEDAIAVYKKLNTVDHAFSALHNILIIFYIFFCKIRGKEIKVGFSEKIVLVLYSALASKCFVCHNKAPFVVFCKKAYIYKVVKELLNTRCSAEFPDKILFYFDMHLCLPNFVFFCSVLHSIARVLLGDLNSSLRNL